MWGIEAKTSDDTVRPTEERRPIIDRDKLFDFVVFWILTIIFVTVAYPLYFVIISSVSRPEAVAMGRVLWYPVGFALDGYTAILRETSVVRGFLNSLYYTGLGTFINLAVTLPAAYALSRPDFYGKKAVTIYYVITMFISGGLIPTYLVVRSLGFLNTVWALVVPGAISVYNLLVARTFFKTTLPDELLQAAKIDGCGNTQFFFLIALPLSTALVAVLSLFYGIGHWNSYFSALIYLFDQDRFPLQLVLRTILVQNTMQQIQQMPTPEEMLEIRRRREIAELMKYSLIIVSSIPAMIVYPLVQKHFVKGVMIGSIKG